MESVKSLMAPMMSRQKLLQALPAIERYAWTVLAVVCTSAIRLALDPVLGDRAPYMFFILPIWVAKRLWGRGQGLLATLLGGISTWYFILKPGFSFAGKNRVDGLNLVGYFVIGVGISFLGQVTSRRPAYMAAGDRKPKFRVIRQTAVLVGAAVILAGMALLLLRDSERTQEAEGWVVHTYRVINSAEALMSTMKDAERGERGFMLTGDERFLAPYNSAIVALPSGLKELKDLTSDNPHQQARLIEVNRLTKERLGVLKHAIELRTAAEVNAALALVRSGQGEQSMDDLRSTLGAVMSEEQLLLVERTVKAKNQASRGRWELGLGSAALIILLVFASVVIEQETVRREEITRALRRHADLLEQAHDSLFTWPLGGTIDYWSRGAETLYGFTRKEAVGRSSHELLATFHPLGMAQIDSLLERDGEWKGELTQSTKDGRKLIVEGLWAVAVDAEGNKTVLEANRDITERKRAEEALRTSESRFRVLFETNVAVIIRSTIDGKIVDCNGPAARMLGYESPQDMLGLSIRDIYWDSEKRVELMARLQAEKALVGVELKFRHKDGRPIWMIANLSLTPANATGETFVQGTLIDITERKRAEAENLLLATAIEQAAESVVITDRDAKIQYVNPAFTRTTGYTRAEALGGNPRILKSGQHDTKFYRELWATLAAGKLWRGEFTNRRKDGTLYMEESTVAPVRDASDEITNYIAIKSDITERKRAELALRESEMMLRFFVQHAPAAIAMLDREMRYLVVSRRWMTDYRLEKRDIRGLSHYEVFPDISERWKEIHQRCLAGAVERCEEDPFPRPDGSVDWLTWEVRPWREADDSIGGVIIFSELVTERKQAEEEIRLLNVELEQRVRSRTEELETANRELEAFAHSVSHDLRAPLRGIDGWSLALLEDCGERLDAQGHKYLERVRSEAQRMGRLIDDLLHLSRVSRAELIPNTIDLTSLAETIVTRLKEAHPDRCIEFFIAPQLKCTGDARLLEVALTNLLDNAVKFTGPRTPARIEFGKTEYEGNPAFFVGDNGVGFDMAHAGLLFGPFQRLHKASEFPGTGIGLATVQRVIHRHGGRIWADARPGAGATLYFTLGADR